MMMKRKSFATYACLALAALFLASVALPEVAHAADSAPSVVKKTTVKKTVHKKKKTTHKKKKKVASSKATVKKVVAKPTLTPGAPGVTVPVVAKPRTMSEMGQPPAKGGGTPIEVVRQFYTTLEGTMKQGDTLGFQGRTARLQPTLDKSFDMDEMMRVAAGPSWSTASPDEQSRMVKAFRQFSAANYASRFSHYAGEKFEVLGEKPGYREGEKVVETRLSSGSDSTNLNYLMHRSGNGQWKIVDVYVDGTISEMATRRSEFGSVLRQQGVEGFLRLLDEKSAQLGNS